ncbi:MAG: hypothetical protein VX589_06610 [Myxococcota bacterium]|nr:hypothetical protein [Myxococcota bacterium]
MGILRDAQASNAHQLGVHTAAMSGPTSRAGRMMVVHALLTEPTLGPWPPQRVNPTGRVPMVDVEAHRTLRQSGAYSSLMEKM